MRRHDPESARAARARSRAVRARGERVRAAGSGSGAAGGRWTERASWDFCCSRPRKAARSRSPPTDRTRTRPIAALCALDRARPRRGAMRLTGLGVSPGIGIGKALVLRRGARDSVSASRRARRARARAAGRGTRGDRAEQLQQIRERIAESAGAEHAYLFDAQLLMLDDAMLIERAAEIIRTEHLNAGSALERAFAEISTLFDQAEDAISRTPRGRRRRRRTAVHEPSGRRR